jgi:DNA-binding MarR family transcriptional regulator
MSYYDGRIDGRLILSLEIKRASQLGLAGRLGLGKDAVKRMTKPAVEMGLVHVWYCRFIPMLSLTPLGRERAVELRSTLSPLEIEKLLTPRKGKRGAAPKAKPSALSDSLGL